MFRFVYVAYGGQAGYAAELRYSLESLLAEAVEPGRISIYTDRPRLFGDSGFETIDISDRFDSLCPGPYPHRIKPAVLLDAIDRHRAPCALLDTDSFARSGFLAELSNVQAGAAAMNFFVRANPYPWISGLRTSLPRAGAWSYEPRRSVMFNSGLVAMGPQHRGVLEDSLALIDFLWSADVGQHDIEQFAISEACRLHEVPVTMVHKRFEHYCQRWSKRYMHRHFAAQGDLPSGPVTARRPYISLSKSRVRLFKAVVRSSAALAGLPVEALAPIPSDFGGAARWGRRRAGIGALTPET